jgi:hypothetical protein
VKKEGKGGNMKNPETITIHVNWRKEEIWTTPPIIKVPRSGVLEWSVAGEGYHFALNFGYNSPYEKEQYQAGPGGSIPVQVLSDAPFGEYKYTIAVFNDGNLLIEDPRFIVRRG